jgi:hypothetical protein
MFEAIETDVRAFEARTTAELGTQLSATQEVPRGSVGVGLAAPQFPEALGGEERGAGMAGMP